MPIQSLRFVALLTWPLLVDANIQSPVQDGQLQALHGEAVAFDPSRDRLVVYGGSTMGSPGGLPGTWEWDGKKWKQTVDSAQSPPSRSGAAMAYDPSTSRIVMFGGYPARPPGVRATPDCDTWAYDGRGWTRLGDGTCADVRPRNTALVYHASAGMLLIDGPALPGDTAQRPLRIWRWAPGGWQLADSSGPRRRGFSQVAYDSARSVLVVPVLFGGPDAGVWEWSGQQWTQVADTAPGHRQTYGLAYDASRRGVVLAGGQGGMRGPYLGDTWMWDGVRWTAMSFPADQAPPGRGGATLTVEPRRKRMLYLGGYDANGSLRELWILDSSRWRRWTR